MSMFAAVNGVGKVVSVRWADGSVKQDQKSRCHRAPLKLGAVQDRLPKRRDKHGR